MIEFVGIDEIANIVNLSVDYYEEIRPYLTTGGLNSSEIEDIEYVTFQNKPSRANQNVSTGNLIIARMKETNKVLEILESNSNLIVSTGFLVIEPINKMHSGYLFHYLKSETFQREKDKLCSGATQKAINNINFKKLKFPLCEFKTQKKIAEILDKADALRQQDKKIIEKYGQLTQSVFLDMFGDPVTNPKGWEVVQLSELLNFLTSGSRGWAKYYADEGDIFLRINNVGKNKLIIDDFTHVNAPDNAEAKRTNVKSGDIIMSITADLGRTAVIPNSFPKAHINQHLAIIRLKDGIIPFYVSQFLASVGGEHQLLSLDKGGVKAGLNFNDIKSLQIPLPPFEMQTKFKEVADHIEKQKQLAQKSLEKSEQLFQSLLQKAFKGELVY